MAGAGGGPTGTAPRDTLARYLVAAGAVAVAYLLAALLGPGAAVGGFPLFLAAVMLAAWYGGLGPGLAVTVLGGLVGTLGLPRAPAGPGPPNLVGLGVFCLEALVITGLSHRLRAAQQQTEALARSAQAARAEAEVAAQRVRALQRVTDAALAHLRLDDLLRELLARIREVLGVDTVAILLLAEDGADLVVRAAHGLEEEVALGMRIPVGRGVAGRIAVRREPMVFEDLSQAEVVSPVLRERGVRSLLGVPLMVEGRVIGVVHVGTLAARAFAPDDVRLLQLVADRVAIAIDHARLYEAERGARAAAEAAERRFRLLVDGVRDYATYMVDRDGRVVTWNAGAERLKGYRPEEVLGRDLSLFFAPEDVARGAPRQALEQAAAEGHAAAEGWRVRRDGSRFWAEVGITALRDGEGALLGFSVITHDLTERRRAAEIRARLLAQLMAAREEEQRRLARELHDETSQSLTSLLVGLRAIGEAPSLQAARAHAGELRRIAARALEEVRRLLRGLRPRALDELGLVAALEHLAAEAAQASGIEVDVQAGGLGGRRLPPAVETALYRIVQEALTNAVRHAKPRQVSVRVRRDGARVQAIVADDGDGFDVEAALRGSGPWDHLGLHGMRERAALLGGSVVIESAPGAGTTLYVWLPVDGDDGADPGPPRG